MHHWWNEIGVFNFQKNDNLTLKSSASVRRREAKFSSDYDIRLIVQFSLCEDVQTGYTLMLSWQFHETSLCNIWSLIWFWREFMLNLRSFIYLHCMFTWYFSLFSKTFIANLIFFCSDVIDNLSFIQLNSSCLNKK